MRNSSRFGNGGCYVCNVCGKKTRSTGRGDNEFVGLCADCYDIAGLENMVSDGNMTQEEFDSQVITNEKGIMVWKESHDKMEMNTKEKSRIIKAVKILLETNNPEEIDNQTFYEIKKLQEIISKLGCKMI